MTDSIFGRGTPLSARDRNALQNRYKGVFFRETFIAPENRPLPPGLLTEAGRLHAKLDRILREQRVCEASRRSGALDWEALWRFTVGNPDVFAHKTPPKAGESDFYLLIERGDSARLRTALLAAAVLEEASKDLVHLKIVCFDGDADDVEHCVIRDFDQKERGCRCCDALDQLAAGGGGRNGYSIRVAAMELQKRNKKRRVLLVLPNGLPPACEQPPAEIADARSAVQAARRRGTIVIPVLYGAADVPESRESCRQMYEKGIVSTPAENLLPALEKLIITLIR